MCRFKGVEDVEYQKVAAALLRMTASIPLCPNDHTSNSQALSEAQREALLESLKFAQIESRYRSVKPAHAKTCSWFLKTPEYLGWRKTGKAGSDHGFLWVKGKPGAGKSTLMKFAYSRCQAKPNEKIAFFFNARGTEPLERTTSGMYRSLLIQLLHLRPRLWDAFAAAGFAAWNTSSEMSWSIESLKDVFDKAIRRLRPSESVTCFIDALDECPESEVSDMVHFFDELAAFALDNRIDFRVLFSSRHFPHITIPRGPSLVLEKREEHTQDIEVYIESKISKIMIKDTDLRIKVLDRIREKASGVFMWVVLVVGILEKSSNKGRGAKHLLRELEALPDTLHELFRELLRRDKSGGDELRLCLQWVLYSFRPLQPQELYDAILIGTDPQDVGEWDQNEARTELFLLNSSKGLTEVIEGKKGVKIVQFIHESVRDYLRMENWLETMPSNLGDSLEGRSHERLKACCLQYINSGGVQEAFHAFQSLEGSEADIQPLTVKLPFLDYAVRYILHHANTAANSSIDQSQFLHSFPRETLVVLHNKLEGRKTYRHHEDVTLLYILAGDNLAALIKHLEHSPNSFLSVEEGLFGTPLFAALAARGHQAALTLMESAAHTHRESGKLLKLCNLFGRVPLKFWTRSFRFKRERSLSERSNLIHNTARPNNDIIATFIHIYLPFPEGETRSLPILLSDAVQNKLHLLLEALFDSDDKAHGSDLFELLCDAICNRDPKTLELLLQHGAETHRQNKFGSTPLHLAVRFAVFGVVKILLDHDAGVETRGYEGRSPLSFCTDLAILRLLLENRADINAKDDNGRNVLSHIVERPGSIPLTEVLLDGGANIHEEDHNGRTPLSWAAVSFSAAAKNIIEFLVERGAKMNTLDKNGRTPVSWAMSNSSMYVDRSFLVPVVKYFVSQKVDINRPDKDGRTPLSWGAGYMAGKFVSGVAELLLHLLGGGAEVDKPDNDGRTPLSWAASSGDPSRISALLKYNASLTSKDKDGRTPYDWAVRSPTDSYDREGGRLEVQRLLKVSL